MRLAAAALLAAAGIVVPGDRATATYRGRTLSLTIHYLMTCGQPGPGPLVVELPRAFRLVDLHVPGRRWTARGADVSIAVPGPRGVTCMSIAEGTLAVELVGVHAPRGTWVIRARIRSHAFTARLRIP